MTSLMKPVLPVIFFMQFMYLYRYRLACLCWRVCLRLSFHELSHLPRYSSWPMNRRQSPRARQGNVFRWCLCACVCCLRILGGLYRNRVPRSLYPHFWVIFDEGRAAEKPPPSYFYMRSARLSLSLSLCQSPSREEPRKETPVDPAFVSNAAVCLFAYPSQLPSGVTEGGGVQRTDDQGASASQDPGGGMLERGQEGWHVWPWLRAQPEAVLVGLAFRRPKPSRFSFTRETGHACRFSGAGFAVARRRTGLDFGRCRTETYR